MTDYVANQSGDYATASTWTPNGLPGLGDTINTNGFAITGVSGTLGDDIGNAITINGGSVTLSGDLTLRPGVGNAGIAFQGGTLNQGAHTITVAPTANGCHGATFANNAGAATVWNSSTGAQLLFSNANGATMCHLFAKPDTTAFPLTIDWDYQVVDGWGNGVANPAMAEHYIKSGDLFRWLGGRLSNCGRLSWRDGGSSPGEFDVQNLAIGWWNGTGYDDSANECVWRIERYVAGTGLHRLANCLWYRDPADARVIKLFSSASSNPIDYSGSIFVNVSVVLAPGSVAHDYTGCMVAYTESAGGSPPSFGLYVPTGAGTTQLMDNLSVLIEATANPHAPSISGDAGESYTINGLYCDGLGSDASSGEVGDQPICNIPVTINNFLCVHGAAGPNPSISNIGQVNGNRWTFHNAIGVILGEVVGGSTATDVGTIRNVLVSQPARGAFFIDAGGNAVEQTSAVIDYIAFDPTDMNALNEDHPVLAVEGYVQSNLAAYINGYGANDLVVADPQFSDPTRHGLTWAATFGFPATLTGLRDALLAGFGVNASGAAIAPVSGVTPAAYRTYMQQGYTSSNSALDGTGFGGVDIGAFDVNAAPPSSVAECACLPFNGGFIA